MAKLMAPLRVLLGRLGGGERLVSTADIRPVSAADIGISIHHSVSAFSINNQHIGVRDLVARGYVIPGGASQRGGGSGSGVTCRTLSDLDDPGLRSVTRDV